MSKGIDAIGTTSTEVIFYGKEYELRLCVNNKVAHRLTVPKAELEARVFELNGDVNEAVVSLFEDQVNTMKKLVQFSQTTIPFPANVIPFRSL